MRAARLLEFGKIEVVNEREPDMPKNGEVIVKVRAAGICGTDIHGYEGAHGYINPPRIMGHELVGEVVEVGSGASTVKTGDKVVIDPVLSCGECYACGHGRNNICTTVKCIGVQVDGGFCDYIKMPATSVFKFSADIPWEHAALMEPFSIAAQVCERGDIKTTEKAAIIGSGPIGLCILQAFQMVGAEVLIADVIESRLRKADKLGAARTVNSKSESLEEAVLDFTGGEGANVIVEAVGQPALLESAVDIASPGARIVVLGFNMSPAAIPEVTITRKELEIRGSRLNRHKFPEVIKWFEDKAVNTTALISAIHPLEKIDDVFKDIIQDPREFCKVILKY